MCRVFSCVVGRRCLIWPVCSLGKTLLAFVLLHFVLLGQIWRRQWQPTPVLLPGKSHGRRSLVGCSPWGRWESDTTERLHFHFSLSCIGEGNGNPLQCSCLENPMDGGGWWAAVYGIAQSRTRLKWLSSSNNGLSALLYRWNFLTEVSQGGPLVVDRHSQGPFLEWNER